MVETYSRRVVANTNINPDEVPLRTYSKETAVMIEKLDLTDTLSREEMIGELYDISDFNFRVGRLVIWLNHAVRCKNNRCCRGFCFSIKIILIHYSACYHLDCLECQRFNMVVFEHMLLCENHRKCQIPGCLSIARANGKYKDHAMEPCSSKSCEEAEEGTEKPGTSEPAEGGAAEEDPAEEPTDGAVDEPSASVQVQAAVNNEA